MKFLIVLLFLMITKLDCISVVIDAVCQLKGMPRDRTYAMVDQERIDERTTLADAKLLNNDVITIEVEPLPSNNRSAHITKHSNSLTNNNNNNNNNDNKNNDNDKNNEFDRHDHRDDNNNNNNNNIESNDDVVQGSLINLKVRFKKDEKLYRVAKV